MSEIPSVKVLEAIKPANSGTGEDVLAYQGLEAAVQKYIPTNAQRSNEVWDSEPGSLEELSKAKQLASEYFLRTADKVVTSNVSNRDLWADRFTLATTELYGEPEAHEATRLITIEFNALLGLKGNPGISQEHVSFLLDTYRPIINEVSTEATESIQAQEKLEKAAIQEYGKAIIDKYKPLFDLVYEAGKSEFNVTDLHELFTNALNWLIENDDLEWGEWEVIESDGTSLSVSASSRQIKIAAGREPASLIDTKGLIAHELLVHALRGKNGYKKGDKKLATGLPGYLDAEEGLGILSEEAVNGELPDKVYDRYLDIALALGTIDGVQRTRKELFQISFARQLVQEQLNGTFNKDYYSTLQRKVWRHIDRIYRGGPGDDLGSKQAIFTKDIAYYVGYKQMAEYIKRQLNSGKTAAEVFQYLSQAKFDPNNPKHTERLTNTIN
jgi:uncharacterized protein DUF1704